MKGLRRHDVRFEIDRRRVRQLRKQHKMTQRQLAAATGFTEDYISQIERGQNTVYTPLTIIKFARALHVSAEELVHDSSVDAETGQVTRRELLGVTALVAAGLAVDRVSGVGSPPAGAVPPAAPYGIPEGDDGLCRPAERAALAERALHPHGSERWAVITLRHCAQTRQQAGDIAGAERYIAEVAQACRLDETPTP